MYRVSLRLLLTLLTAWATTALARAAGPVYVVKVEGAVWPAQVSFIHDSLEQARKNNASAVLLEINTLGGLVDSANEIKDLILDEKNIPTVAWIHNRAISAGALIALSADKIAIAPGATIGAAAVRTSGGQPVDDPKVVSYWRKEFEATAKARNRNPDIATAMVSAEKALPDLNVKPGDILTLDADEALRTGIADFSARGVPEVIRALGLPATTPLVVVRQSLWEQVAKTIVLPWMTIILLVTGCVLLFIEMLTLHTWGLTGTLGTAAVLSVFAAHITVGTAGWVGVVLILAGLVLLLLETHVFPGFGISGILGLLLSFLGMFYALGGSQNALFAVSVSTILTIAVIVGFFAYLPRSAVWKKLGQQMQQRAALGYVTSDSRMHFLGRTGRAVTVLRPAGAAEIDGVRLDVVTEGEFLDAGTPVLVIKVEGSRIVVDDVQAATSEASPDARTQAA